uniref:Uncharacterized protein n=2 Tax=Clytia hemisphaerica TaxID=252671 RepID=A0A7M5U9X9_9CNID
LVGTTLEQLQNQLKKFEDKNQYLEDEINHLKRTQQASNQKSKAQENVESTLHPFGFHQGHLHNDHVPMINHHKGDFHEQRLMGIRQETEYYRQQLELEQLRQQLHNLRGHPNHPVLPSIGTTTTANHYPTQQQHLHQQHPWQQQRPSMVPNNQHFNEISTENNLYSMTLHKREEVFEKSPYDPTSGFTIFWDFLHMPTTTDQSENTMYHISVTLYKGQNKVSETRNLPVLHQNNGNKLHERAFGFGNDGTTPGFVTISVKQIFPKCFPSEDISLIVSLQITKNDVIHNSDGFQDNDQPMRSLQMVEYGWCKLTLFDSFNRVTCGRWKCPMRAGAIQLEMSQGDMNSIPQLGQSELYYRLINSRDVETQDNVILNHQHLIQYKYTPIESKHIATIFHQQPPIQAALPPPIKPNSPPVRTPITQHPPDVLNLSTNTNSKSKKWRNRNNKTASNLSPLQTQGSQPNYSFNSTLPDGATSSKTITSPITQPMNSPGEFSNDRIPEDEEIEHVAKSPDVVLPSIECDVGIQIDKLVNFQANKEVRIVLSIRNPNGKVTFCNDGEAILSTPWKRSTFLENAFVFGLHQKFFQATQLFQRSIIFVEVFEKQIYESQNLMDDLRGQSSTRSFDSERLIGWGLFKLFEDQSTNIGASLMSARNNRTASASVRNASNQGNSLHESMLRFGYLDIPLYQPPLPNKIKTTIKKLL